MSTYVETNIYPTHLLDLKASGLSDESIEKSGIYSAQADSVFTVKLSDRGVSSLLVFPYQNNGTECNFMRAKLFPPISTQTGKTQKYYSPAKRGNHLYSPKLAWKIKDDPDRPIYVTEGEKKALKACQEGLPCIAISGLWNFTEKGLNNKSLIDDFKSFNWSGREVYVVPDNDYRDAKHKKQLQMAVQLLATKLFHYGANVHLIELPSGENEPKGLDDFLVKHGKDSFEQLEKIAFKADDTSISYFKEKAFIPKRLADEIMHEFKFINCKKTLYVYHNGVYWQGAEDLVKKLCRDKLKEASRNNRLNEVISHIADMNFKKPDHLNKHDGLINFKNGMFDWKKQKLLEHSHKYYSSVQIPINYDPSAACPMIDKFFETTIPNDCIPILIQMLGYFLVPDTSHEKAFMLTGTGANGKSTFLYLLEKFIGDENVSKVPLQELDDHKFKRAELFGKFVNLFADLDSKAMQSSSYFKTIVSGDSIDAEEKQKKPFFFKPFARLIFSANEIPSSSDNSYAYFRRWVIIPFPNTFKGTDANKDLKELITTDKELSGLLNYALAGLLQLHEQREFSESKTVNGELRAYEKQNDPVKSFVDEKCSLYHEAEIERSILFDDFMKFCHENGYKEVSRQKFYSNVIRLDGVNEKRISYARLFSGITLMMPSDLL